MNDLDKLAIKRLAEAQTYHGNQRRAAVRAYERELKRISTQTGAPRYNDLNTPFMNFMSEVLSRCPDLVLRFKYRNSVKAIRL